MSAIPDVSVTVRDGALGLVATALNGQLAVIGPSSSGTGNSPVGIGDIQTLVSTFGSGPLVELGAQVLQEAGGPILAMRLTTADTGALGSVTHAGTGTSALTPSNSPPDDADVIVKVITGAAAVTSGVGTFQVSLDGGLTYGPTTALPTSGTYTLANGILLTFATGTLVAGDTYSFHCTAPAFTNTELGTAMDALLANAATWFGVAVAGIPADASTWTAMVGTLDTKMEGAASSYARYAYAYLAAPALSDSALITAAASVTSKRVCSPAGFENRSSAISGNQYKRPVLWSAVARAAASVPSEDPGRVASGPLQGVTALSRDEFKTPGLDNARFLTATSRVGLAGFFITQGKMLAPVGSDYSTVPNRRVVDLGTATARNTLQQYINEDLRVDRTTGGILEQDARNVENRVNQAVRAAIVQPGFASDCSAVVDRSINLLSTQNLKCTVRILPKGYARYISLDIGLTNPALTPV
jgi:hypothetical protein